MNNVALIGIIGYIIACTGFLGGAIFCLYTKVFSRNLFDKNNKNISKKIYENINRYILGFSAGLLIAFVCFEMLPIAFENDGIYLSILGIISGVFAAVYMGERVYAKNRINGSDSYLKMGTIIALGVIIHNIPEGIALGSLLSKDFAKGIYMGIIIAIHCFPESIAIMYPLKKAGISNIKLLLIALCMAIPMAIGVLIGAIVSSISTILISFSLSFAGGAIIYIVCGEIIPESKHDYRDIRFTVCSALGFIVGIILTVGL
jgi:zinc transporter, ZIP family